MVKDATNGQNFEQFQNWCSTKSFWEERLMNV